MFTCECELVESMKSKYGRANGEPKSTRGSVSLCWCLSRQFDATSLFRLERRAGAQNVKYIHSCDDGRACVMVPIFPLHAKTLNFL
jgi:hypothetical protein